MECRRMRGGEGRREGGRGEGGGYRITQGRDGGAMYGGRRRGRRNETVGANVT